MRQPNAPVEAAFETLRSAIDNSLENAWKSADDAVRFKDLDAAQNALEYTRSLEQLLQRLSTFRSDFEACVGLSSEPAVSDVGEPATTDNVKGVARRRRSRDLDITSREEYYGPILESLVELGGRAKTVVVLDRVGEKMQHRFTEDDRALLPEGGSIRWRNHAQWSRLEMVKEGLLQQGSPSGVWEITAQGRAWLENRKSLYS